MGRIIQKKDTRTYRGFKFWPTKKLEEVLDDPYCRGVDGHDYGPYEYELRDVLNERLSKLADQENERLIREMEKYDEYTAKYNFR